MKTAPLTKTEQVLAVLKDGGCIRNRRGGVFVLRDRKNNEVPAWQNAIKAADRIHQETCSVTAHAEEASLYKFTDAQMATVDLAFEIADHAARSDIECECLQVAPGDGFNWYDTAAAPRDTHSKDQAFLCAVIDRADRYLTMRGAGTHGFHTIRNTAFPHLVRFESKP